MLIAVCLALLRLDDSCDYDLRHRTCKEQIILVITFQVPPWDRYFYDWIEHIEHDCEHDFKLLTKYRNKSYQHTIHVSNHPLPIILSGSLSI